MAEQAYQEEMDSNTALTQFLSFLEAAITQQQLIKLQLTRPTAEAGDLKSIDGKLILVKRELKLSLTYHHRTNDTVKNYTVEEASPHLKQLLQVQFSSTRMQTTTADFKLTHEKNYYHLSTSKPTVTKTPDLNHDRSKQHVLRSSGKPYLYALGLTNESGHVLKAAQDKFRQINKYIEILDGLVKQLPKDLPLRVADMGAGKGYLTFALYDHLANTLKRDVQVTGVEYRADLVEKCNGIAAAGELTGLKFVQGTIAQHAVKDANIIIALHACDTATDDAIASAVKSSAELIVVAPCCHKQIRRDMQKLEQDHPLHPLLKHGTYVERTAEMITDSLRAQLMERAGYRTKLFEFIGGKHTPKNVMIVGSRASMLTAPERQKQDHTITTLKAEFGIRTHYLETLLD